MTGFRLCSWFCAITATSMTGFFAVILNIFPHQKSLLRKKDPQHIANQLLVAEHLDLPFCHRRQRMIQRCLQIHQSRHRRIPAVKAAKAAAITTTVVRISSRVTILIVSSSFLRIAQYFICFRNFFEFCFCIRFFIDVWMILLESFRYAFYFVIRSPFCRPKTS